MNLFEKKCCEENETVKSYFEEGMIFEAWTIILRETNLKDGQNLYDELQKVIYRKGMSEDEKMSLDYEFWDNRECN